MRWLADECVAAALVGRLRAVGHDVVYMAEIAPAANDVEVMAMAQRDGRLLLTEDKDFGDLVFGHGRQVPGIVLLRIDASLSALKAQRLDATIAQFGESLFGRYVSVDAARFRSRPLRG